MSTGNEGVSKNARTTVYLTPEAKAKMNLLPNFSQWVCDKLLSDVVVLHHDLTSAPQIQPKIKENWCADCKAWSPDSKYCPYCSRKCETRER